VCDAEGSQGRRRKGSQQGHVCDSRQLRKDKEGRQPLGSRLRCVTQQAVRERGRRQVSPRQEQLQQGCQVQGARSP
jgi:hypothetical protein